MSAPNTAVTEDELHVYVDGELPADRREAVEQWLSTHPDDAMRVAAWRAQAEAIRARYRDVIDEPVPERLTLGRLLVRQRPWRAMAAAAAVVAFVAGAGTGWMARGASASAPSEVALLTSDALDAHKLYISEVRHPIEVRADEDHLLPWLSRRVGTTLRAPDLEAFNLKLLGGRLLPGVEGPAALFMYEGANGERFTIYCSRVDASRSAFRYNAEDGYGAIQWIEGQYGWVISGPKDRDKLKSVATAAYDQIENRTPAPSQGTATQLLSRRGS